MPAPLQRPTRARVALFTVLLILPLYCVLEAGAWGSLRVLRSLRDVTYQPLVLDSLPAEHRGILTTLIEGRTEYLVFSAELGWTIRAGGSSPPNYRANAQGLRGDRDQPEARPDSLRIAAFGDSFTHGDGVPNAAAWPAVLEAELALPVLNFGVGGYGLDQAYLRYREEGARFQPDVVLIGLMSEDPFRHVNVYRPFYAPRTGTPLAKPRFLLRDGQLELVPNPISTIDGYRELLANPRPVLERLGAHDAYFHQRVKASTWDRSPTVRLAKVFFQKLVLDRRNALAKGAYPEGTEALAVTTALLDRFVADVETAGAHALVLLLPGRGDLRNVRAGKALLYEPIRRHLEARGYAYVDLLAAFEPCEGPCDLDALIPAHYSELGNRKVAAHLAHVLRDLGWLKRPSAASFAC